MTVNHDSNQVGMTAVEGRGASEPAPHADLSADRGAADRSAAADGGMRGGSSDAAQREQGLLRWRLRNWRMRWRVVGLVVIPTVAAIMFGTLRIAAAQDTSAAAGRIEQLGVLGGDINSLAEAIQDERDLTAGYVAARLAGSTSSSGSLMSQVQNQYAVTGTRLATVQAAASKIGPAFPSVARQALTTALASVATLPALRQLPHSEMSALQVITHYSDVIQPLLAFDNDIAAGSSSAQLAQAVTSLATLVQVEEQASQQRAMLFASLLKGSFEPGMMTALTGAQSSQTSDQSAFQAVAANLPAFIPGQGLSQTDTESQQSNDTETGPDIDAALAIEQNAIISGQDGQSLSGISPQTWFTDMTSTMDTMRTVENYELGSVTTQASALQQGASNSRGLTEIIVLVLLVLVLLVTLLMARSLINPLRRLRTDALDVAGRRLPNMVRLLSESQGNEDNLHIEPIGVNSTDEIGEVARAFDQVHQVAVRLAGDEALLRANLNAMFVNLSRRSQSLVERQLGIIESLEQSEQDDDRLTSLFRLDHLATRMRRNSENLLVLAGHETPRKWSQPVPLVDVVRAAVSEIEEYNRISVSVQPGIMVSGRAATDVVHLVAEIAENAATFSGEDTQVLVSGQRISTGGVLLNITDNGLGIPEQDLAYANWRLENPPVVDVAVSRRMGLFVVGRLASRHGIKVRLQHARAAGLTALIWLPDTVAQGKSTPTLGMMRRRSDVDQFITAGTAPQARVSPTSIPQASIPQQPSIPAARWDSGRVHAADLGQAGVDGEALPGIPRRAATTGPAAEPFNAFATEPVATGPVTPEPPIPQRTPAMSAPPPAAPPPAAPTVTPGPGTVGQRLPIYDSLESDWFRRGGQPFSSKASSGTASGAWSSPADEGWRAAAAVSSPASNETTTAGLPRRVPSANLVPGSIGGRDPEVSGPSRSPEEARSRMSRFQNGLRQGRSATPGEEDR